MNHVCSQISDSNEEKQCVGGACSHCNQCGQYLCWKHLVHHTFPVDRGDDSRYRNLEDIEHILCCGNDINRKCFVSGCIRRCDLKCLTGLTAFSFCREGCILLTCKDHSSQTYPCQE